MHARDRYAAIAVIDKLSGILRSEFGEAAHESWPILSKVLQNFLGKRQTTITSLADSSGMPRTTARRVIFALKAQGLIQFKPISAGHSREHVLPSERLLAQLDSITGQTIKLLMDAVDPRAVDRFDAAGLAAPAEIAWPRPAASGFNANAELTLLAYADPVFDILKHNRTDIERFLGMRVQISTYPQDAYRAVLEATLADPSHGHANAPVVVAVPFPWLAELSGHGQLLDLQALAAGSTVSGADFYDAVWQAGWSGGHLHGIPVQPTVDFLWYRKDLFDAEGLQPPRTFAEVIRCASLLHRPSRGRFGITWTAAPGLPLAEMFLQILGAQGGVLTSGHALELDAAACKSVIEYLRALIPYSPGNLRANHWTRSVQIFGSGNAAMCYHWSNRFGTLDGHKLLEIGASIGLLEHPTMQADMTPLSPLGGALLAIPSACDGEAIRLAWQAVETLGSPEMMKYFVLHGAAGNARYSVAEDRYVLQRNRVVGVMDQLMSTHRVAAFPAPAVPAYHALVELLSTHLEALLFDGHADIEAGVAQLRSALAASGASVL
ncbi:ABC transporter substrate-binding protein [Paraburkholderia acidiphila]|uniref:Extracellular solute-binding protein n=1 Tax=Paraburkholderia acidiphila TaxID=2571747 RepID=A0A7Z2JE58_9BURK|nr:extracellular solute-binding protein [Paraburkholderia acidiphila]QGZ59765.1 extracellular solute-binding protein [Paraburkholderia acidiphila]